MSARRWVTHVAWAALAVWSCAGARAQGVATLGPHKLLVVNRGNHSIFDLRIGRDSAQSWSADLLGFERVIDVSSGLEVQLPNGTASCVNDVLAVYSGGHREIAHDVNLCTTSRVDFAY